MISAGAGMGAAYIAIGSVFCLVIFLLSLYYGSRTITRLDTFCLVGGLMALAIYVFLHNPLLSIVMVIIVDFIGFMPTLRKIYIDSSSETMTMYALCSLSNVFALGALTSVTVTTLLCPVSFMLINGGCAVVIATQRRKTSLVSGTDKPCSRGLLYE